MISHTTGRSSFNIQKTQIEKKQESFPEAAIVKKPIALKPDKYILLYELFAGNDRLKTYALLQMRDAEVEFKMK